MQILDKVTVHSLPSNKSQCFRKCLDLMPQPLVPASTCCCCSMGTGCSTYLLDTEEWSSPAAPPRCNPSLPIRSRLPPRLSWRRKDHKREVRFCFLQHPKAVQSLHTDHYPCPLLWRLFQIKDPTPLTRRTNQESCILDLCHSHSPSEVRVVLGGAGLKIWPLMWGSTQEPSSFLKYCP